MIRIFSVLALSAAFASAALAQQSNAPAPGSARPAAGEYSGTLQEWAGGGSADVKLHIRNVTADGRVTGHAQTTGSRKMCNKRLPLSGITLPDGGMRLEVNAGAPDGCERIYNVKAESGSLSGTYIDAVRARRPASR